MTKVLAYLYKNSYCQSISTAEFLYFLIFYKTLNIEKCLFLSTCLLIYRREVKVPVLPTPEKQWIQIISSLSICAEHIASISFKIQICELVGVPKSLQPSQWTCFIFFCPWGPSRRISLTLQVYYFILSCCAWLFSALRLIILLVFTVIFELPN